MSLKTSYFSSAIFKADIKRFWWTAVVELLFFVLGFIIPIYENCQNTTGNINLYWNGAMSIPLIFSCAIPVLVLSYLHSSAPATTLHSYPITRKALFTTKVISSLTLTMIPVIVSTVILALMLLSPICAGCYSLWNVAQWSVTGVCYSLIVLTLTIAVNMMTGNSVAAIIFTVGFALLPGIFAAISEEIFREEILGFSTRDTLGILEYIYIDMEEPIRLLYVAYSAVLLAIAYYLYKFRKIESNGEIIAYPWLKPVFIGIISILASGFSYVYFTGVLNIYGIFTLLPLGILGAGVAHMISKKALDFKGCIKPIGIYIICALCFIGIIKFDLTGFEKRIPRIEDIDSVTIDTPLYDRYYGGKELCVLKENKNIESVLSLHQELIKQDSHKHYSRNIYICYNLKNGKKLVRDYKVNFDEYRELLIPVYENEEAIKGSFSLLSDTKKKCTNIEIQDRRLENNVITIYPNEEIMPKIISALKKDVVNCTFDDLTKPETLCTIHLYWEESRKYYDLYSEVFCITPTYKNTLRILKNIDDLHMPTAEDISEIRVSISDRSKQNESETRESSSTKEIKTVDIALYDQENIEKVYAQYSAMIGGYHFENYENAIHVHLTYKLKSNHEFTVSCSYDSDKLPEVFKELVNNN